MPRNGSGVYGPPAGTTATSNTPIESAKYNAYVADNAEAMTNSINVDGTAPWQTNQPWLGSSSQIKAPGRRRPRKAAADLPHWWH
jgi:hypothetical protein